MWYLILGCLLGLFIGWFKWGRSTQSGSSGSTDLTNQLEQCKQRCAELEASAPQSGLGSETKAAITTDKVETQHQNGETGQKSYLPAVKDEWRPTRLSSPDGQSDDLKRVKGIGPVIEKTLNDLGIFHFHQIASFSENNIAWVDNHMDFPGRIKRENWVSQAQQFAKGAETEFPNR